MYLTLKRIIDVALSLAACILLLPLFLVIALGIRLESPGSPIFTQVRVGRDGKLFTLYKFRSMVKNAAALGTWYTTKGDARITRTGRFLRATSLDELPQLWNVVVGDMSLIGPRPELPVQESLYSAEDWRLRHRVRPGITGLAQVNGRSEATAEARLNYDLTYARQPTLGMDIHILLKTFSVVLRKSGVN